MRLLLTGLILIVASAPLNAVTLRLRVDGDSTFFAPPGDTVSVEVAVDSEDASLTGVEVFLAFDPRLFRPVDADPAQGVQPVLPDSLLGDVLADTLVAASDSLSLIHFAETDLSGRVVNGRLGVLELEVLGWHSGSSDLSIYQNAGAFQTSAYTLADADGATVAWPAVPVLTFRDLPPVLLTPPPLVVEEDEILAARIDTLASDETAGRLAWEVEPEEEGAPLTALVQSTGDSVFVLLEPDADFHGTLVLRITATDPGGGTTMVAAALQVLPVNDAPVLAGTDTLTVALSAPETQRLIPYPAASDVDDAAETLIWASSAEGAVEVVLQADGALIRVPEDWAGEAAVTLLIVDSKGLSDAVLVTVTRAAPSGLVGDFDADGDVDFADFLLFAGAFLQPDADPQFDLNDDGRVDFSDFLDFAAAFGS